MTQYFLKVSEDTVLKPSAKQSSELDPATLIKVPKSDRLLPITSFEGIDDKIPNTDDGHIAIKGIILDGVTTPDGLLYVFERHATVVDMSGDPVYPAPEIEVIPDSIKKKGKIISIPGVGDRNISDPIIPGGNFTWGEATHEGTRIPTAQAAKNIIELAKQLQRAREAINKPFRITSWYRPEPFNSRAGGAKKSQHLSGKAVDIVVSGYSGATLAKELSWWPGGRGIYPGNRRHILHLDIAGKRKWGF